MRHQSPLQHFRRAVDKATGLGVEGKADEPDGAAVGKVRLSILFPADLRKRLVNRGGQIVPLILQTCAPGGGGFAVLGAEGGAERGRRLPSAQFGEHRYLLTGVA